MLQKYDNLSVASIVLSPSNGTKIFGGPGSAPDPAGGAHDAPSDPLVDWGGGRPPPQTPPTSAPSAPQFLPNPWLLNPRSPMGVKNDPRPVFRLYLRNHLELSQTVWQVPRATQTQSFFFL
jgi:hypothetical protein